MTLVGQAHFDGHEALARALLRCDDEGRRASPRRQLSPGRLAALALGGLPVRADGPVPPSETSTSRRAFLRRSTAAAVLGQAARAGSASGAGARVPIADV